MLTVAFLEGVFKTYCQRLNFTDFAVVYYVLNGFALHNPLRVPSHNDTSTLNL